MAAWVSLVFLGPAPCLSLPRYNLTKYHLPNYPTCAVLPILCIGLCCVALPSGFCNVAAVLPCGTRAGGGGFLRLATHGMRICILCTLFLSPPAGSLRS
jgi:hypothetical protein